MFLKEVLIVLLVFDKLKSVFGNDGCNISLDASFSCRSEGNFRDPADFTCTKYYSCIKLSNGFITTHFACSSGLYFNPIVRSCISNYVCPCLNQTTVTTSEISTNSPHYCGTSSKEFECTSVGLFNNGNDLSCSSYYLCVLFINDFVKTKLTCPFKKLFDPNLLVCSNLYSCPCVNSSIKASTERNKLTTIATNNTINNLTKKHHNWNITLNCTSEGFFSNTNDTTCLTYYLCIKHTNNYIKILLECHENELFDPNQQTCTRTYQCATITTIGKTTTVLTTKNSLAMENPTNTNLLTTTEPFISPLIAETGFLITKTQVTYLTTEAAPIYCTFNQDQGYFRCLGKGRYPNYYDLTCKSYYLCNLLTNGSFIQTKFNCPAKTYLNDSIQLCDKNYKCPCLKATSTTIKINTEPSFTTKNLTSISQNTLTTIKPSISSLPAETGSSTNTKTQVTYLTTEAGTNPCIYIQDPNYFKCLKKGRYPNYNDLTCQSYFLCNMLRNGYFIRTKFNCPAKTQFNISVQRCDRNYKCPCLEATSTTINMTTEKSFTTEKPTSVFKNTITTIKPSLSSSPGGTGSSTTTKTQVTYWTTEAATNPCNYNQDPKYFKCLKKGRYSNYNDLTCQSYFLCNMLRNGSFIQTKFNCPAKTYFNNSIQLCDKNYKCPCLKATSTTIKLTTEPSFTTKNITSISQNTLTTIKPSVGSLPAETGSFTTSKTQVTYLTTEAATNPCIYNQDPEYFKCLKKGRFPNYNDFTCQSYFLCTMRRNGSFIQTKFNCPAKTSFNVSIQLCDKNYKCPCVKATSTTINMTTEKSFTTENLTSIVKNTSTTIKPSTSSLPAETGSSTTTKTQVTYSTTKQATNPCIYNQDLGYFKCIEKGRYPNYNDLTCQSYFLCNMIKNGSFIQTKFNCPAKTYFNDSIQLCDKNYICPCLETTFTTIKMTTKKSLTTEILTSMMQNTLTTIKQSMSSLPAETGSSTNTKTQVTYLTTEAATNFCIYNEDPEYFKCLRKGRFPNYNDFTCQSYFLCNMRRNGSFIQTKFNCPAKTYFNDSIQLCDKNFKCPCLEATSTTINMTTEKSFTTENLTSIIQNTLTTLKPSISSLPAETGSSATTKTQVTYSTTKAATNPCIYNQDPEYFKCLKKGRYPNYNDLTCQSYLLCNMLRNGSFIQTKFNCPAKTYFNDSVQMCAKNYKCPCLEATYTTIKMTTEESFTTGHPTSIS